MREILEEIDKLSHEVARLDQQKVEKKGICCTAVELAVVRASAAGSEA
jgi:hypothetical protein